MTICDILAFAWSCVLIAAMTAWIWGPLMLAAYLIWLPIGFAIR